MFVTLKRICMEPPTQINIRNEMSRLRRLQKSIRDWWQIYLLILPALVFIVIFSYIPMYGLQIAFKDYKFSLGRAEAFRPLFEQPRLPADAQEHADSDALFPLHLSAERHHGACAQ